jgi:hypothetical protein
LWSKILLPPFSFWSICHKGTFVTHFPLISQNDKTA